MSPDARRIRGRYCARPQARTHSAVVHWDGGFRDSARVDSRPMDEPGSTPNVRPATPAGGRRRRAACTRRRAPRGTRPPSGTRAGSTRRSRSSGPAARTCCPVEHDLIGDLRGRLPAGDPPPVRRRARHALAVEPRRRRGRRRRLQPADAGARARGSRRRPAPRRRWVEADVLETPHDLDGTADLVYTGRGAILWLQDLDAWAAVLRRLLAPDGPAGDLRRPPGRVAVRRRRRRRLDADRLRLLRGTRGVPRLGARVHRPPVDPRGRPAREVRPVVDAGRDRDRAAGRRAARSSA